MRAYLFQWRMASRRKQSCLLVLLFTFAATIFMLIYPNLMENTRKRLDEAYDTLEVSGWMVNALEYKDPSIPGSAWHTLVDSDCFSEISSYASLGIDIYKKEELDQALQIASNDEEAQWAFQQLYAATKVRYANYMRGYNRLEACDDLLRMEEQIQWLEGYSSDCLESDEKICIISENFGYQPGDLLPLYISYYDKKSEQCIIRLKVVGVYPGSVPDFSAVMPLKTVELLCNDVNAIYQEINIDRSWDFKVNSFSFVVKDNRQLAQVRELFDQLRFDGSEHKTADGRVWAIRTSIDDRVLQGTVAPIESNLALLEGLYLFFFAVITMIGFFLCFLLARNRKAEYAVMRLLGESMTQITMKALMEQSLLCLAGVVFGSAVVLLMGQGMPDPAICGIILLCYTLGAAIAVLMTVRVNVMEILRDKE